MMLIPHFMLPGQQYPHRQIKGQPIQQMPDKVGPGRPELTERSVHCSKCQRDREHHCREDQSITTALTLGFAVEGDDQQTHPGGKIEDGAVEEIHWQLGHQQIISRLKKGEPENNPAQRQPGYPDQETEQKETDKEQNGYDIRQFSPRCRKRMPEKAAYTHGHQQASEKPKIPQPGERLPTLAQSLDDKYRGHQKGEIGHCIERLCPKGIGDPFTIVGNGDTGVFHKGALSIAVSQTPDCSVGLIEDWRFKIERYAMTVMHFCFCSVIDASPDNVTFFFLNASVTDECDKSMIN